MLEFFQSRRKVTIQVVYLDQFFFPSFTCNLFENFFVFFWLNFSLYERQRTKVRIRSEIRRKRGGKLLIFYLGNKTIFCHQRDLILSRKQRMNWFLNNFSSVSSFWLIFSLKKNGAGNCYVRNEFFNKQIIFERNLSNSLSKV